MQIQDFLIAAIQNMLILLRQPERKMSKSNVENLGAVDCSRQGYASNGPIEAALNWFFPWRAFYADRLALSGALTQSLPPASSAR